MGKKEQTENKQFINETFELLSFCSFGQKKYFKSACLCLFVLKKNNGFKKRKMQCKLFTWADKPAGIHESGWDFLKLQEITNSKYEMF